MELILGIDLGTSYFKLGLFDRYGEQQGLGRVAVPTESDDGCLCELSVERFWSVLREGLQHALTEAGAQSHEICAVGYSSQANSFLLLDKHDTPLTPLILWLDSRVQAIDPVVKQLFQRDEFLNITGLGLDASCQFAIIKCTWLKQNKPDCWAHAARIMTISDYLTFSLTQQYVGDAGTASLLGLLDVQNLCWWREALHVLDIPSRMLSTPLRPGTIAGPVTENGTRHLGLRAGIPFVVGSLDHHAAALGAGLGQIANISESTGTVLACVTVTDNYLPRKTICTGVGCKENEFFQLAFSPDGASVLDWYQNHYAPQYSISKLIQLAGEIPPGCDGLIALSSPNQYDDLRGFLHAKTSHTHGHFVRAIMEMTAQSLKELIEKLCPGECPSEIVSTGGGAQSDLWLHIKKNIIGPDFIRIPCREPACKGAALLATSAIEHV